MLERLGWNHEAHPGLCTPPSPTARPQVPAALLISHTGLLALDRSAKNSPPKPRCTSRGWMRPKGKLRADGARRAAKGKCLDKTNLHVPSTCFYPALEAGHLSPSLLSPDAFTQMTALQAQKPPCASQGLRAKCRTAPSASRINQKCIELPGNSILSARP